MSWKRRLGLGLVVVGLVVGARLLSHRAVDVELAIGFGPRAAALRSARLIFTDAREHVERELSLTFRAGAQPREHHRVRLHQGDYTVGARLEFEGAPPATPSRPLHVDEPGTYDLDFSTER